MTDNKARDAKEIIDKNWARYLYGLKRGHKDYCEQAKLCERFYIGKQWDKTDLDILSLEGRPAFTFNEIFPKINSALGYQINNRADISFKPSGGQANDEIAWVLSKLAMQISKNNKLHRKETDVFSDGLIQQRGYFDIRIGYDDTILGEVAISTLDPLDVIPDPDAKYYDPDDWADVTILRWLTAQEIEAYYGVEAKNKIISENQDGDEDFGDDLDNVPRNSFAGEGDNLWMITDKDRVKRYRVVDRQHWEIDKNIDVIITPTGDIRPIPNATDEQKQKYSELGNVLTTKSMPRVRWTVTTRTAILKDEWSPYNHFTVVPYFPFFRRGLTLGLVDTAIDPQKMLNKAMSQYTHVVNTSANSGWFVEENSLVNMRTEDLETEGAKTGVVIEYKQGKNPPSKIQPNQVPSGIDRIIDRASNGISTSTGINEAMQGAQGQEVSGVAIQSRQFAAQQQLANPLDSLSFTRELLAGRMLELIQQFYDMPRIERISDKDKLGNDTTTELYLNIPQEDESILNDLTIGEYDTVIDEVPAQITFENSQFTQLLEIGQQAASMPRELLIPLIRHSNVTDKQEIIESLSQQQEQPTDPLAEVKLQEIMADIQKKQAEAQRLIAQAKKTDNEAVKVNIESLYSSSQAANVIATNPATAPIADQLSKSAGFTDQDAPPIVAEPNQQIPNADLANPTNTNPLTPASPTLGVRQGILTPEND